MSKPDSTIPADDQVPGTGSVLPDFLAFAVGLGSALALGWTTNDLIWSLWLSSLILGYLTILCTIAVAGIQVYFTSTSLPNNQKTPLLAAAIVAGLFLLGFFTVHFGMFHFVHGVFLSLFFPFQSEPLRLASGAPFPSAMALAPQLEGNPANYVRQIPSMIAKFWPFLVATLIAERRGIFQDLTGTLKKAFSDEPNQPATDLRSLLSPNHNQKLKAGPAGFSRPYRNVVRMHLLIFFFAFAQIAQIAGPVLFAIVYAVYFFPWAAIFPGTISWRSTPKAHPPT